MSESMIERVAREICVAQGKDPDWVIGKPAYRQKLWETFIPSARAALKAIRRPNKEILAAIAIEKFPDDWEAGRSYQREVGPDFVPPVTEMEIAAGQWMRAIDAALQD